MELCFYLLAEWPLSHDVYMLFYAKNLVLLRLFCSYFLQPYRLFTWIITLRM
jgi:hypothetical protein